MNDKILYYIFTPICKLSLIFANTDVRQVVLVGKKISSVWSINSVILEFSSEMFNVEVAVKPKELCPGTQNNHDWSTHMWALCDIM